MAVQPDGIVRLMPNIALDPRYDHTIWFDTDTQQADWFRSQEGKEFPRTSYQRPNKGSIRLQAKYDTVEHMTYMMFQNASYGARWWYAFVTAVDYINDNTVDISYELDVMQSYRNHTLEKCFVVREHSMTDNPGDNTIPENFELGDYVSSTHETAYDDASGKRLMGQLRIIVAATFDSEYKDIGGNEYGGIYSGLYFHKFSTASGAANFILNAGAKSEGIVSVFMMPNAFTTDGGESAKSYTFTKDKKMKPYGFTPNNNKLLTYPYNFLYVTNLQGQSACYPYEYFSTDKCSFAISGDMSCNPSVVLAPRDYKGLTVNFDEKMVLSGFPICSYTTDTFKAWLAQSASSLGLGAITGVGDTAAKQMRYEAMWANPSISLAATAAYGASAFVSVAAVAASACAQVYTHSILPDHAKNTNGNNSLAALGILDFVFMTKHIRDEYAHIIDEYFDMYGYATNRVKVPNRNGRPKWNYVKTAGCIVKGYIPASDIAKICSIYDKGITFWKDGSKIGKYGGTGNNI